MREVDSGRDRDHFQDADLAASVAGLDAAVALLDRAPGQVGQLTAQPGLVAFDREHPVRASRV